MITPSLIAFSGPPEYPNQLYSITSGNSVLPNKRLNNYTDDTKQQVR